VQIFWQVSMKMKAAKLWIFGTLTFILHLFQYEILYSKYVDLLDMLKEKKNSIFSNGCKRCGWNGNQKFLVSHGFHVYFTFFYLRMKFCIHSKKQSVNFGTRNSYSPRFQNSTKNKIKLILVFNFNINMKPSGRVR
jgi:hypothetical protein